MTAATARISARRRPAARPAKAEQQEHEQYGYGHGLPPRVLRGGAPR